MGNPKPSLRFFISHVDGSKSKALKIRRLIQGLGHQAISADDVPVGAAIDKYIKQSIKGADAHIAVLGPLAPSKAFVDEVLHARQNGKVIIPVWDGFRRKFGEEISFLSEIKDFLWDSSESEQHFSKVIGQISKLVPEPESLFETGYPAKNFKIEGISIQNVRSIRSLELDLSPSRFTVLLGDNSVGKSSFLRALAIGLASLSDATALVKKLSGPLIRNGADFAEILIDVVDSDGFATRVRTTLRRGTGQTEEVEKGIEFGLFDWEDLFLCAYGTNRSREATNSFDRYSVHSAVQGLFEDSACLQNPELILLRQSPAAREALERSLLAVLMLDQAPQGIGYSSSGPELPGPWGNQPLRNLSDGYRSTAQWILDFLHWAILAKRLKADGSVDGGILILDELEQHLHPRWQRHIVQRLAKQFPITQIFTSTHTPLVAAGVADLENANLIRLIQDDSGDVSAIRIDPQSLRGKRADQILASDAFGLLSTRNLGSELDTERYAILLGMKSRGAEEEQELQRLQEHFDSSLRTEESPLAQDVEKALDEVLKTKLSSVDPKLLDVEVKRQIQDLFSDASAEPSAK